MKQRYTTTLLGVLLLASFSGCKAPLKLDSVHETVATPVRRTDELQAVVANNDVIVVVGARGVVLRSTNAGKQWRRLELGGDAALIDVASCPDQSFVALDFRRRVWTAPANAEAWEAYPLDSIETPVSIECDARGHIWVTASFSTLLTSKDQGRSWQSISFDEDLFLTGVQFLSPNHAVATGEFGAIFVTRDGGETWEPGAQVPEEFYIQTAWFEDDQHGWVAGLAGVVQRTDDGGTTWHREPTETAHPIYEIVFAGGKLFAIGDRGVLLHRQSAGWKRVTTDRAINDYLAGALPIPDNELLIVGGSGSLVRVAVN